MCEEDGEGKTGLTKGNNAYHPDSYWNRLVSGAGESELDQVGWEDMGRAFNFQAYRLRGQAFDRAIASVAPKPPEVRVFEAGFGVGYYLRYWRTRGVTSLAGVDLSHDATENCRLRFPTFDLRQGDISKLAQSFDVTHMVELFDIVTAIDVIYHVVDDTAASDAVRALASLVAPGGALLISDKFPPGVASVMEAAHVTRRPASWYASRLAPYGLEPRERIPVFWCLDKPSLTRGAVWTDYLALALWTAMRGAIRFWPRNSAPQLMAGSLAGRLGVLSDSMVVPRLQSSSNLSIAVFVKSQGGPH